MEQADCERNKARHGSMMNNLDVEQPDLNPLSEDVHAGATAVSHVTW